MASSSVKSKAKYFCGHCDQVHSKTLFFQHKRIYYDSTKSEWSKQRVSKFGCIDDFDFEHTGTAMPYVMLDLCTLALDFIAASVNHRLLARYILAMLLLQLFYT